MFFKALYAGMAVTSHLACRPIYRRGAQSASLTSIGTYRRRTSARPCYREDDAMMLLTHRALEALHSRVRLYE